MIVFATGNKFKFEVISKTLQQYGIEFEHKNVEMFEPDSDSLTEIALSKAKQAFSKLKVPLIVEDTGFYSEAYPGFPGTNPKWVFEKIGYEGIFKLLSGKSRKIFIHTVICFIDGSGNHKFFEGKWHGKISKKVIMPKVSAMPYARIFIPDGEKRASVEMSFEEKDKITQRSIAAHKLGQWLKEKSLHELIDSI